MKKSLVSDVPISVVSGGLDSSILQIILKQLGKKIDLISFIFKDKNFSEEKYIKEISKEQNLILRQLILLQIFKENLKGSIKIWKNRFLGYQLCHIYYVLKT